MQIRKMVETDIDMVCQIAQKNNQIVNQHVIPVAMQQDFLQLVYQPTRIKQRMKNSLFFVLEVSGEVKGFAHFSYVNKQGNSELLAMYVEKEYQRRRLGTQLLQIAKEELHGIESMTVHVEASQVGAISFLQTNGFRCEATVLEQVEGILLRTKRLKWCIN